MNKFETLSGVLEFIEENLSEEVTPKMCADFCGYSLSNLQKMFRRTFNIGVSDYISRRKLTLAARELINSERSVLDIAVRYGYNSHEVFTRAFRRLWGVAPAEFRKKNSFSEIFPKLSEPRTVVDEGGNIIMTSKKFFDVSCFYDYIKERQGCCVICFDIVGLMSINDTYGHSVGDLAIAKCLLNIDSEAGENMLPIRVGGDEFVLITDCTDISEAKVLGEKILAHNGETVKAGDTEVPVTMRAGYAVIPEKGNIRYNELFDNFIIAGRG